MDVMLIAKGLMAVGALIALWFVVSGLRQMSRLGSGDNIILTQGVVCRVSPRGRWDCDAVLLLNIDEAVLRVSCVLPGPWFGSRRPSPTDLVRVYWRRGDMEAVAEQTVKDGQTMLILGFAALALMAILWVLLF
ncbi:MAG: hypothetical protein IJ438_03290 [Clostridia bacterium]|nr:hypothetical protein [Clostridia bacterium]